MSEKYNLLTKFRMHLVKHVIQFSQNNSIFKISARNFIQLFWLLVINTNEVKNYVLNVLKHNLLNFEDLIGSKIMWQNETPLILKISTVYCMHLSSLSWKLVTNMICLFSKYFWDEAKCVVEPNSLDLKNLNSKLYTVSWCWLQTWFGYFRNIFETKQNVW